MTLKVSITLPGDVVITFEASEPQFFREVMGLTLRELPKDLMRMQTGGTSAPGPDASGKNVVSEPTDRPTEDGQGGGPTYSSPSDQANPVGSAQDPFVEFCASLSPLGDMRRVVVAAEGAKRFLALQRVSEIELRHLFDLVGWRQPADFLQTLRNAARSKFRWLERVPGAPGYYTVSETGRDRLIGSSDKMEQRPSSSASEI